MNAPHRLPKRARLVALLVFIAEVCFLPFLVLTIAGNSPTTDGTPTHVLVKAYGAVSVTLGFCFLGITLMTTIGAAVSLELFRSGDVQPFPLPIVAIASSMQAWVIWISVHSTGTDYFFVPAHPLAVVPLAAVATLAVWQLLRLWRIARSSRRAG